MSALENTTILVGVDGSQGSIEALAWAGMVAEDLGTRVTAAMVWRDRLASDRPYSDIPERPPDNIDHQLIEQLEKAVEAAGLDDVGYLPLRGSTHEALIEASARDDVALVVVGTRGLGPIAGLLLGSVSRKLLFATTCPLVLVPRGTGLMRIQSVVVGIDGSPVSEAAAVWSAMLCANLKASATVVHCLDTGAEHSSDRLDEIMTEAQLRFEKAHCAVFRGLEVPHESVVENGDPRLCLIKIATTEMAGLIIIGQHGEGQVSGLGGTASYLVRHSPLPLTIIPGPTDIESAA